MSDKTGSPKRSRRTGGASASSAALTAEERAAMRELVAERRAQARGSDGASDVLVGIAEMPEPDRAMAQRFHEIVTESVPSLTPRTWYGMPACA